MIEITKEGYCYCSECNSTQKGYITIKQEYSGVSLNIEVCLSCIVDAALETKED